jgi:hypothetical protein
MEGRLLPIGKQASGEGNAPKNATAHLYRDIDRGNRPRDPLCWEASASAQSARETRVAPVGVVVRVPVTRLRHDECELAHAVELRGDRDGCLRAA